jgi:NADPH:quinone reductase-like Zn-dependent oxidoreductase
VKAAVVAAFGEVPRFEDFPDPVPSDEQRVIQVLAAPVENFDRAQVSGRHYASRTSFPAFPAVAGHAGVGVLNGKAVSFGGCVPPYGAMAEKTLVPRAYEAFFAPLPEGADAALFAAMPSSLLTALLPLTFGAKLMAGETVLVQGATGFAGRIAVQLAKRLGAGRVVGTGRDAASLGALPALGADAVIDLSAPDAALEEAFRREAGGGYDVVLDYVWGHATEVLLRTLVPTEAAFAAKSIRVVQLGASAGDSIELSAEALRTSGVVLMGASAGIEAAQVPALAAKAYEWIASGAVTAEVERVALCDIEAAWTRTVHGRRLVVMPDPAAVGG